jgi:S1-C subfamily serine protease
MKNFFRYSSTADLAILGSLFAFLLVVGFSLSGGKSESYLYNRAVKLISIRGTCSGEQVRAPSGIDYILTAAHCLPLAQDGSITIITEDGRRMQRKVIAEDTRSDLLLLEGVPNLRGLDIADYSLPKEKVRTFTHGRGLDTYKTEGVLIQNIQLPVPLFAITSEGDIARCQMTKHRITDLDFGFMVIKVCLLDVQETITTAMIVPGSSGGMVVDANGDLVGVVSAGDGFFGYLVRLEDIRIFIRNY